MKRINITTTPQENRAVVAVSGRIDAVTAASFREAVFNALASVEHLELDFNGLTYISSAGLRVLLLAVKASRQNSTAMVLRSLSPEVLKIMQITGLDTVLTIE